MPKKVIREGNIKKGGINPKPSKPKPRIVPPAQKPKPKE